MFSRCIPRTRKRIADFGIDVSKLNLLEPLPYIEFLSLQRRATAVVTDSGGIQEETTYLNVPCLTLRSNTERPVTVTVGTNILVGQDGATLRAELSEDPRRQTKAGNRSASLGRTRRAAHCRDPEQALTRELPKGIVIPKRGLIARGICCCAAGEQADSSPDKAGLGRTMVMSACALTTQQ